MVATREEDGYICIINAFGRYRDVVDACNGIQVDGVKRSVAKLSNFGVAVASESLYMQKSST